MIFVDSNIPMYLVGAPHPNKEAARRLLENAIELAERLGTDALVLLYILHRYTAIGRPDAFQPAFNALMGFVDEVLPIEGQDVERARDVLLGESGLSSRDALHVAVMRRHGVRRVMTFDTTLDRAPGLERVL